MYLDKNAISDIKNNFSTYKNHFSDETNEWFLQKFNDKGWIKESKIQCKDFELNYDENFDVSDRKNIEILYESLKELSPVNASDERLWAGMLFSQFWKYVKYRRAKELNSGNDKEILNSFFFLRGTKRSCFLNCLSRLWWTGYLLYDNENTNHYKAIDLITESAFASNIILLSSSNFMSNKSLALGVMDCIISRKEEGEDIKREHFVEVTKYLNCLGGVIFLDSMTREEIQNIVNKRLNKI